jgi:hypothetical protein
MRIASLLFPLLFALPAFGQGVRYDNYNVTSAKNVPAGASANVLTLPNSIVTVCGYPAAGNPCTNTVPIYFDQALTQQILNPLTTDAVGRFGFWISPALYSYSVQTSSGTLLGVPLPLSLNMPPGPPGPGGVGCGTGSCLVTAPAAPQSTTQLAVSGNFTANSITPILPAASPVNIIWSDDFDTDPDAYTNGAAILHYVDTGAAKLLAVVADSDDPYNAPAAKILTNYWGYPSIPIGAYQGVHGSTGGPWPTGLTWSLQVTNQFAPGDVRTNYPACVTTLRTALAAAANSSVVLVTTGFAHCIYPLILSPADGISTLTGAQLVQQKVIKGVIVAGDYPSGVGGSCGAGIGQLEFNFCADDPEDWSAMLTTWKTQNGYPPLYFVSFTQGINGGTAGPPSSFPTTNPEAYALSVTGFVARPPWGQIGLYYSIFGNPGGAFTISANGTNVVNAVTGANTWSSTTASGHFYLTNAQPVSFYEALFDGQHTPCSPSTCGSDWYIPYGQMSSLLYPGLEISSTSGATYSGGIGTAVLGNYKLTYGPTGNVVFNRFAGSSVQEFQIGSVFGAAIGVDDGSGGFMTGASAGDAGIRVASGHPFYFTDPAGNRKVKIDQAGGIHVYAATASTPESLNIDDIGVGRFVAVGPNPTTAEAIDIEGDSSDVSVQHILARMNAAGFIQIGNTSNIGVDQAGNAAWSSLKVGPGVTILNSSTLPQVGAPTVGKASCIKAAGPPVVIGFCSTVVDATGACTCN